jgi:hypothetical protein
MLVLGAALAAADVEPNDDLTSAEAMVAGTQEGSLNMTDRVDVYKMEVAGGDIIGLAFKTLSTGTQDVTVKDAGNVTVTTISSSGGSRESINVYIGCELDMVWWYLLLSVGPTGEESPGDYELSLFYDMQDDGGTEGDAPCDISKALMLDPGEHTGEYGFHDTKDVYRVVVKAGWTLGLCLECSDRAGPMKVKVFTDDDMTTPMLTMEVADTESCSWLLPAVTPLGTNWYICLEGITSESYGEYTLTVDMDETDSGPPKIVKVTPRKFDPGQDLKVVVTIDEDTEIELATLFYRVDGKGAWKEKFLTQDGDAYVGKIKGGDLEGADKLEYYIVATDTTGFQGALGTETDFETMGSTEESPGTGSMCVLLAMITIMVIRRSRMRP